MSRQPITRRELAYQTCQINQSLPEPLHLGRYITTPPSGYDLLTAHRQHNINDRGRLTARDMAAFLDGISWGIRQAQQLEKGAT